jgi:hypothetical protein
MKLVPFHREQCRVGAGVTLCAMLVLGAPSQGSAQQPVPGPAQPPPSSVGSDPILGGYRLPTIVLVQPAGAATLQRDRPTIVFRFAAGEPNDPIDLASFAVTVDGRDRTRFFQVTGVEAWGSLASDASGQSDSSLALGTHQISARICSARGACGVIVSSLTVVPSQVASQPPLPTAEGAAADSAGSSASSGRRRVIDAIIAALRKLLSP